MKKKFCLRALGVMLSLCLVASMASPSAYATTPEQEAVLASGQRSLNNPKGVFTTPEAVTDLRLFHPATRQAARLIVSNAIDQLRYGNADLEAMPRILAYAPIVTDEELPPRGEWDDILQYMLQNGIRNVYIVLRETDRPGIYQLLTLYSTRAGEVFWVPQSIEYEPSTGWIYDTEDKGLLGIGYDYNAANYLIRSAVNGWNRALGYNLLFDIGAPLVFFYIDTLRFPFSYDGRDWMIQFWKGIYLLSNGAEIGIYERDPGQAFFWDASDTTLDVSMQVYQGETLFFDYGTQHTWWTGGFRYGNFRKTPLLTAKQLRLTGTIAFEDQAMLDAFLVSFEENRPENMVGNVEGLLFSFDWQTG